jgi:hypothetical protein
MESLNAPAAAWIPLVLRSEFDGALGGALTVDEVVEVARGAGLESAPLEPHCLAHRRVSQPGVTRQVYFAVFRFAAFERFRTSLAARAAEAGGGTGFEPEALSPVMFVAASDAVFHRWLPIANPEPDCVAPIHVR